MQNSFYPNKVASGYSAGSKIKPDGWPNGSAYVYAIVNSHSTAASEVSFPGGGMNAGLGDVNVGPASSVNFSVPIRCTGFMVGGSTLSVVWRDQFENEK